MESPVIDFRSVKNDPKEDVKDERKGFLGLEYTVPVLIQSVTPVKAPEDDSDEATKELFEVNLTGYLDASMISSLFSKANGHFVKVKF